MPPVRPPIEPMLAKLSDELPPGDGYLFEPKWDGFRAIVFRGSPSPARKSSPSSRGRSSSSKAEISNPSTATSRSCTRRC